MAAEYLQRMGERMAERRKELGLTQEQVARSLPGETSGSHVSRWERGQHRPSDDTLEALAKVLRVDVAYFLAAPADKNAGTPDLFAGRDELGLADQLDRIEKALDARRRQDLLIDQMLQEQTDILREIRRVMTGLPADATLQRLNERLTREAVDPADLPGATLPDEVAQPPAETSEPDRRSTRGTGAQRRAG
jgi:transcriptional regulator with XRE-family HTH domain